jgi:hypothetical protein
VAAAITATNVSGSIGLALPQAPGESADGPDGRGLELHREGEHVDVRPFSQLRDGDGTAIAQRKRHLLALIDYVTERVM